MTRFTAIDLSKLPAPQVIRTVEYEVILAEMKAETIRLYPQLEAYLSLESEPAAQILRVCAYYRMIDKLEFNDGARAVMLAYATGADLDNLGAYFGVQRPIIQEANDTVSPPIPELKLSDEEFRRLIQLSLEGHSTAGPRGAYIFWALQASGVIKDVSVDAPRFERLDLDPALAAQLPPDTLVLRIVHYAGLVDPMPGDVAVTVLSRNGDGTPAQEVLDAVNTGLNDEDIRPLTDHPRIKGATIVNYEVEASLILLEGPDSSVVLDAARAELNRYIDGQHRLGHDITIAGLHAALYRPGVQNVLLTKPAADIVIGPDQAAFCPAAAIALSVGGRDV